jgi:hypothetical protein
MWIKNVQRVVLLLLVGFGFYSSVQTLASRKNLISRDEAVRKWDENVENLRAFIPFGRGAVGYLSDADIPGAVYSADDLEGEYVLTQYAISPLILINGTEQEWNVLNLSDASFETWTRENGDHFDLIASGGGLHLVRRKK